MYKDKLKEIILDEKEDVFENLIPRKFNLHTIPGKALILTGVRRSGKSTFLKQFIRNLNQPYFYINFSDERIANLPAQDLGLILEAFYELEPEIITKNICIGLDEIQIIRGWEYFVDRLIRTKRFTIGITGSSSKLLSKEIATEMRGRSLVYEFFPLNFEEYIYPNSINKNKISTQMKSKLISLSKKFFLQGGFPEIRNLSKEIRTQILQDYYNAIFFKDVIERNNPRNPQAVLFCLKLLINQTASLYSLTKTVNKCKSAGINITKTDVSEFIKWFEDCYLLFSVSIFAESINRQMTNPRKIYCIDNGLVRANQSGISANTGHLLENFVFTCLRRRTEKIFYFKENFEVDFVVQLPNSKIEIIQVCESLSDAITKKRELSGVSEAMETLNIKKATLVTLEEKGIEKVNAGEIQIVPLWEYALGAD